MVENVEACSGNLSLLQSPSKGQLVGRDSTTNVNEVRRRLHPRELWFAEQRSVLFPSGNEVDENIGTLEQLVKRRIAGSEENLLLGGERSSLEIQHLAVKRGEHEREVNLQNLPEARYTHCFELKALQAW